MKEVAELAKIRKFIVEIIDGDDSHFKELKKIIKSFFKDIKQDEINKIGKDKLKPIINCYDLIANKDKLSEVDKGFLNMYLDATSKKYIYYEYNDVIKLNKFKKVVMEIYEALGNKLFEEESKNSFMAFIGWVLANDSFYDDIKIENDKKDLHLKMDLMTRDKPEMNLQIIGVNRPEYKTFIDKLSVILAQ